MRSLGILVAVVVGVGAGRLRRLPAGRHLGPRTPGRAQRLRAGGQERQPPAQPGDDGDQRHHPALQHRRHAGSQPGRQRRSEFDVVITGVNQQQFRSSSSDILVTAEYQLTINATVTYTNRKAGRKIFDNIPVTGSTYFFTQADIQEGERQALPLAAQDLANNAVKLVTEGW
ncbi:MAG: LPS assembly lipoprotein LptE [Verrucomicrobiota bacterium]